MSDSNCGFSNPNDCFNHSAKLCVDSMNVHVYGFNEMDCRTKLQTITYMQTAIMYGASSIILDGRKKGDESN